MDEVKGLGVIGSALLGLLLFVCGLYGFQQSYELSIFAAILAMLWCSLGTAALLYYGLRRETRKRALQSPHYALAFFGAVSVFALLQMMTNPAAAYKADNELTRFATCWWVCLPGLAIFAVFADRASLLVRKSKPEDDLVEVIREELEIKRVIRESDNVFAFDPERFKKDE